MPAKNIVREYATGQYYHVYSRGAAKLPIFIDSQDKGRFIKVLRRHLDASDLSLRADGVAYRKFNQDLELLCYCLMGNHFHLLFYTKGRGECLTECMKSVLTAYTMYFNKRHKRVGALFEGAFKASRIKNESYLLHITRYIHLNPRTYKTYFYSSLPHYLGAKTEQWLNTKRILGMFEGANYLAFLEDYEEQRDVLQALKSELADS